MYTVFPSQWGYVATFYHDCIKIQNTVYLCHRTMYTVFLNICLFYNKNVIYKYPPIFLTLTAFLSTRLLHSLNTVEACARQFSPIKQLRLFALASFSILLLWLIEYTVCWAGYRNSNSWSCCATNFMLCLFILVFSTC